MKITARASGGFAGRAERFELDTGCHRDGQAIESLLDRLDFFQAAPACPVGADQMEDSLDPAGWQALIGHLRASR